MRTCQSFWLGPLITLLPQLATFGNGFGEPTESHTHVSSSVVTVTVTVSVRVMVCKLILIKRARGFYSHFCDSQSVCLELEDSRERGGVAEIRTRLDYGCDVGFGLGYPGVGCPGVWVQMRENSVKMLKINDRSWAWRRLTFFWTLYPCVRIHCNPNKTGFMLCCLIKHFKLVAGLCKINHLGGWIHLSFCPLIT